jgi:hypothetical protein
VQERKSLVVNRYDTQGQEIEDSDIASFSFDDPRDPNLSYCVGYRFMGGRLSDPHNWVYDHTNLCVADQYYPIDLEKIEAIVCEYAASLDLLLEDYCRRLEGL